MVGYTPSKIKSGPVIEPDTFWELIERILLHSTQKEHSAVQSKQLTLSALCRGRALPQLPRQQKLRAIKEQDVKSIPLTTKQLSCHKCQNVPPEGVMIETKQPMETIIKQEKEIMKTKPEGIPKSKMETEPKLETDVAQQGYTMKRTKSECQICDLDIEFIKDADVPASERLWRYAMRNKRNSESQAEKGKVAPNARSNEAIYKGLKKRMDDAHAQKVQRKTSEIEIITDRKHNKLKKKRQQKATATTDTNIGSKKVVENRSTSKKYSTHSLADHGQTTERPTNVRHVQSMTTVPADIAHVARPLNCKRPHMMPALTGAKFVSVGIEHSKPDINASRAMYDSVIKKRLTCGNQLETLNKEMIKKVNTRYVLTNDTMRKYNDLKSHYLNLCCQESQLRHDIAVLHAEIYTMQNKGFHKRPASVKTITLDSKTAHLHNKASNADRWHHPTDDVPLFPPLKAPRPLILSPGRAIAERMMEKHQKSSTETSKNVPAKSNTHEGIPTLTAGDNPQKGTCTVYSLTPEIISPPRRRSLIRQQSHDRGFTPIMHRLPRMRSTGDIKTSPWG